MTEQEKHLSLALDALTHVVESIDRANRTNPPVAHWRESVQTAMAHIEAAAIPKPSRLRPLMIWRKHTDRRSAAA